MLKRKGSESGTVAILHDPLVESVRELVKDYLRNTMPRPTVAELADAANLTLATVVRFVEGKTVRPQAPTLSGLLRAIRVRTAFMPANAPRVMQEILAHRE